MEWEDAGDRRWGWGFLDGNESAAGSLVGVRVLGRPVFAVGFGPQLVL